MDEYPSDFASSDVRSANFVLFKSVISIAIDRWRDFMIAGPRAKCRLPSSRVVLVCLPASARVIDSGENSKTGRIGEGTGASCDCTVAGFEFGGSYGGLSDL